MISISNLYRRRILVSYAMCFFKFDFDRSALLSSSSINSEIGGLSSVSNLTDPFLDVVYPPIPSDGGRELETHQNAYLPRMIYRVRVFHPFEHLTIATALSEIRTDVGIAMDVSFNFHLIKLPTPTHP